MFLTVESQSYAQISTCTSSRPTNLQVDELEAQVRGSQRRQSSLYTLPARDLW